MVDVCACISADLGFIFVVIGFHTGVNFYWLTMFPKKVILRFLTGF